MVATANDYCQVCQVVPPVWGDKCRLCTVSVIIEGMIRLWILVVGFALFCLVVAVHEGR